MISSGFAYIGPGMAVSTIVIVVLISLLIIASLGFTVFLTIKRFFKRRK